MSDTPKFEVIDRRKYKAEEEEREAGQTTAPATVSEPVREEAKAGPQLVAEGGRPAAVASAEPELEPDLPPAPTAEETREQKFAYDASAQRLEDLVRAQNPGGGPQPPA